MDRTETENPIRGILKSSTSISCMKKDKRPQLVIDRERKLQERKERAARIIQGVRREKGKKNRKVSTTTNAINSVNSSYPSKKRKLSSELSDSKKRLRFSDETKAAPLKAVQQTVRVTWSSSERTKRFCRLSRKKA